VRVASQRRGRVTTRIKITGYEQEVCSVHAHLLDKARVAQSLDENRLTGSLLIPRDENYRRPLPQYAS
jgi:hypothetical protein